MKKVLIALAVLLVCLAIAAYLSLNVVIKKLALRGLNDIINTKADINTVNADLLNGIVSFTGIDIQNPNGYNERRFLAIDKGYVKIDLPSLFTKEILIRKISIDNLTVNIEIANNGVSNNSLIFKKKSSAQKTQIDNPSKKETASLKINEIIVNNGTYKLTNYKVNPRGASVVFDRINLSIVNLTPPKNPNEMPTSLRCQARLPASDLIGNLEFNATGGFLAKKIDFDLTLQANNISLPYFMPFYSNTAPIFTRSGYFNLTSQARCRQDQLEATQKVDISDLILEVNNANLGDNSVFGLPVLTVVNFFMNAQGKLTFEFEINGTMDNPQFHLGEALKKVLANSIKDAILKNLAGLSGRIMGKVGDGADQVNNTKEILEGVIQKILTPGNNPEQK